MIIRILLFLVLIPHTFLAARDHHFHLDSPNSGCGLFANVVFAIGFLADCEKNNRTSFVIDFEDKGHYYVPEMGKNWWSYYFEPVEQRSLSTWALGFLKSTRRRVHDYQKVNFASNVEEKLTRYDAARIIQKYIKVKPEILAEVNQFTQKHFDNRYVIAIHYRGTDKMRTMDGYAEREAPEVKYGAVFEALSAKISSLDRPYSIFVATDEAAFLEAIKKRYPGQVLLY